MSPATVKKMIKERDEMFQCAVNELLSATPVGEDPVELLQAAARDHVPVNPKANSSSHERMDVPSPENRPSVDDVITEIQKQEGYGNQIVDRRTFTAREAREGFLDEPLSDEIRQALRDSRKIESFYTHQVAAINAISHKKHVIVSTSTASGKSVIYQVPILRFLEGDPSATGLFIYPTKALAQDQIGALQQLLWSCPTLRHVSVATYDGDTPQERRAAIRKDASIIFTNFDTIHMSILPHEELWRGFLRNLKLMAVDELHYYSDLMGSHVAQVIRRLRRICEAVGNREILFVSCSATISKPAQHMRRLFGIEEVDEITEDGAPSGCKDYLVWKPRNGCSAMSDATSLMKYLMKRGVRVIMFCKIRKACELAMKALRTALSSEGRLDILAKVMSYRGGYSQQDRRRIEHEAFSGNLLGIVATNALELGIDIGVLDAVIMLGFPLGLANFRQQAGRAGRRSRDSLAVFVADTPPLDQHYANHPEDLYNKPLDELVIDLDSKEIVEAHLQCAAHELPLSKSDTVFFGPLLPEICDNRLTKDEDGWYLTHPKYLPYPAKHVSIRGIDEEKYVVVEVRKSGEGDRILEELEVSRALFEVYEGGVFLHQGKTFIVKEVSHDSKIAKLERMDVDWITSPRDFTDVDAKQTYRIKEIPNSPHRMFFGRVDVITVVFGFYRILIRKNKILDTVNVNTPPLERHGTGFWFDVPENILDLMRSKDILPAAAIHSACHAWMNHFALAVDLRTECKAPEKEFKATESQRKRPARLIFFEPSGKSGVTAQAFDHASDVLKRAQLAVEACPCTNGCINCILCPRCKENNAVSSKIGALLILQGLLNLEVNDNSVPTQTNEEGGFDTIVKAGFVRPIDGVQVEVA